jgi:hypothetical protein
MNKKNQGGFAIGLILGVIALMAILGAVMATSFNSNGVDVSAEEAKTAAASILNQGFNQQVHFEIQAARGGDLSSIAALTDQVPPSNGMDDNSTNWVISESAGFYTVDLAGVNDPTCRWINFLQGYTPTPSSPEADIDWSVYSDAICLDDGNGVLTVYNTIFDASEFGTRGASNTPIVIP